MRVLILGGYGVFGGRLARLLADEGRMELLIAGRDRARAERFCAAWDGAPRVRPLRADRRDLAPLLGAERPDVLVDASGPFQDYGPAPYAALEAALDARIPYLDFSDGAAFVEGVAAFDARARAAGVFALSGVSSFPVLTAAVLAEAAQRMELRAARGGIAPSPHAGVGGNVLRAVLGYAGAPVALRRDGREATGLGLVESWRRTVAPPGALPLRPLRFSLVDVPDLRVLPRAFPGIGTVWMGAAPQPAALHRLLSVLALARARLGLPSLAPLAPLAGLALSLARGGEDRGGMIVEVDGMRDGRPLRLSWHMVAEGADGPLIPSMAIEALLRRTLAGDPPPPGARSGAGSLSLADYEALFARRRIRSGWREEGGEDRSADAPLYARLLGPAFAALPPSLRAFHGSPGLRWSGRAEVERGRGPLAALACRLFGFPPAGADLPVEVALSRDAGGREIWSRRFAGRPMRSAQEAGAGREARLLVERFGPFAFALALVEEGGRLRLVPRRWRLGSLPLPLSLMPRGEAWEEERDGRFRFHVEIRLPLLGRLVRYRGWLLPEPA